MSSPIVDTSCLLEKPGGSVTRHRICFHRTRQTIIQLPRIVWSSTNRCHQKDWDIWPASKRHTHFGGGSVHFAQKYWHPVRVHKGSTPLCNTNEKPNRDCSVQEQWNHGIDENSQKENFKWDEVHRTLITFAANFRGNWTQIPRNDASVSRNRLSHGVFRTYAAVYGSFWSQEPSRILCVIFHIPYFQNIHDTWTLCIPSGRCFMEQKVYQASQWFSERDKC
jgi:hypothetical protein